jgi:hypothetical protein
MVDTLVPGVSTLTRLVRYYSLYWALAAVASERDWDVTTCQTVLRRAEVALAMASRGSEIAAHGADRVGALLNKGELDSIAELGRTSYSPRAWGFWSQYNGPSVVLGTVEVDRGTLRPGPRFCPTPVRQMFEPLLDVVAVRALRPDEASSFANLAMDASHTPDLGPLRELFTATHNGRHVPGVWNGNDQTRRSTLRILARSVQLQPEASSWADAMRKSVAYGNHVTVDPILSDEQRAAAWRGVLLRHHSVGAWRRLWAELVEQVITGDALTKDDLCAWITSKALPMTVRDFLAGCPATVDGNGDPQPAEDEARTEYPGVVGDLAILLYGGQRKDQLSGQSRAAFLGRYPDRKQFLDPNWVAFRYLEHEERPMAELARAFVGDMLAQSRRVALRKLKVDAQGRMTLFTKLHERNGRFYADRTEGSGNVGLRIEQLEFMAGQLGLSQNNFAPLEITPLAAELLALPA